MNSDAFTVYGGLALEREFKGSASGEAAGLGIDLLELPVFSDIQEVSALLACGLIRIRAITLGVCSTSGIYHTVVWDNFGQSSR